MKESFILYTSFYEPLKCLTNEQLGRLFKAIFEFNINGNEEVDSDIQIAFAFIKNQINIDSKKYEQIKKKRAEAGARGGRQRATNQEKDNLDNQNQANQANATFATNDLANDSNDNQNQANQADNDNVNDNDNDNDNVNDNDKKEIYKEKETSSEDKSSTDDTAKASKKKEVKHKYGEYKHVLLKDKELQKLKEDSSNWQELLKYHDEYIEMQGYKANNHYLCIKKWVVDAVKRKNSKQVDNSKSSKSYQSYSQREYTNEEVDNFYDSDFI